MTGRFLGQTLRKPVSSQTSRNAGFFRNKPRKDCWVWGVIRLSEIGASRKEKGIPTQSENVHQTSVQAVSRRLQRSRLEWYPASPFNTFCHSQALHAQFNRAPAPTQSKLGR